MNFIEIWRLVEPSLPTLNLLLTALTGALVAVYVGRKVEHVKAQHALLIEEVRSRGQLRQVAAELRLKAHQEAYYLWTELLANVHKESVSDVVADAEKWWRKNCLFLSPEAREALTDATHAAFVHSDLLQAFKADRNSSMVKANFEQLRQAGDKIAKAVHLPPLGERDLVLLERSTAGVRAPTKPVGPPSVASQGECLAP